MLSALQFLGTPCHAGLRLIKNGQRLSSLGLPPIRQASVQLTPWPGPSRRLFPSPP
jgi:hypothetical protein